MKNETKLLSCPFCGGEAVTAEMYNTKLKKLFPIVKCLDCECRTPMTETFEEAIAVWNTRKPMERILEKLNERIEHHVKLVNYEMNMGTIVDVERHEEAIKATDKAIEIVKEEGGV